MACLVDLDVKSKPYNQDHPNKSASWLSPSALNNFYLSQRKEEKNDKKKKEKRKIKINKQTKEDKKPVTDASSVLDTILYEIFLSSIHL